MTATTPDELRDLLREVLIRASASGGCLTDAQISVYACRGGLGLDPVFSAAIAGGPELLAPQMVSEVFSVCSHTPARWADEGKLLTVLTPGAHRRFWGVEVRALLRGESREVARRLAEQARAIAGAV